jgi:hypothetical protein
MQMDLAKSTFTTPSRYFFNLANGREVIADRDGVELPDINAVMTYVFEMIDQVKSEPDASEDDWLGWRLDIADATGRRVYSVPLDETTAWLSFTGKRSNTLVLHS